MALYFSDSVGVITIPIPTGPHKLKVISAHVPDTRLLIEPTANRLWYHSGFVVDPGREHCARLLSADGVERKAYFPPVLNQIVSVKQCESGGTMFETEMPHRLDGWGNLHMVIGLSSIVEGPFDIAGDRQFVAKIVSEVPALCPGVKLYCPPSPSPQHMARELGRQLGVKVTFLSGTFRFGADDTQWMLQVDSGLNLGIGQGMHRLPYQAPLCPGNSDYIELDIGNMKVSELAWDLKHKMSSCEAGTIIVETHGTRKEIHVPPGAADPAMLCRYLNRAMSGQAHVRHVESCFEFHRTEGTLSLEFEGENFGRRLGFSMKRYSGGTVYRGAPVRVPEKPVMVDIGPSSGWPERMLFAFGPDEIRVADIDTSASTASSITLRLRNALMNVHEHDVLRLTWGTQSVATEVLNVRDAATIVVAKTTALAKSLPNVRVQAISQSFCTFIDGTLNAVQPKTLGFSKFPECDGNITVAEFPPVVPQHHVLIVHSLLSELEPFEPGPGCHSLRATKMEIEKGEQDIVLRLAIANPALSSYHLRGASWSCVVQIKPR
jgi:hypothetical protein